MEFPEIEKITDDTFEKIMDSTYATKYRYGDKPCVVDEIINILKMRLKERFIKYVIYQHMDAFFQNKLEGKPEIIKELLNVMNIDGRLEKKASGLTKVIADNYLKTVAQLKERYYKTKSKRISDEQDLTDIENYLKYMDLVREYTCISHSIYYDKFVMDEVYNR